jgi:hypothetical protein
MEVSLVKKHVHLNESGVAVMSLSWVFKELALGIRLFALISVALVQDRNLAWNLRG